MQRPRRIPRIPQGDGGIGRRGREEKPLDGVEGDAMNGSFVRLQLKPRSGLAPIVEEHVGIGSAGGELVAVEGMPLHVVEHALLLGGVEERRGGGRVAQVEHAHVAFATRRQTGSLREAPRHAGHIGSIGTIGTIGTSGPSGTSGPIRPSGFVGNSGILECESVLGVRNVVIGGLLVFAQVVDQDRAGGARRCDDVVVLREKSDFGSL